MLRTAPRFMVAWFPFTTASPAPPPGRRNPAPEAARTGPRRGQQRGQGGVPGGQGVLRLVAGQRVQRLPAAAQPRAAGEVRVDEVAPDTDRHPVGGLGAPRHELDREARLGGDEDGAAEQHQQRDQAVVQALQVAGRGHLQVVSARHRQVDLGHVAERGDHRRDRGELDRLDRVGPAGRVAEQVVQPLRFGGGVPAAMRLDADLAAQGDRVYAHAGPLGDGQLRTTGSVSPRTGPRSRPCSRRSGRPYQCSRSSRTARLRRPARNSASAARTSAPPSNPCQRSRSSPTSE